MVEILKQGQYTPLDVISQVMIIAIAGFGCLDDMPVNEMHVFEEGFYKYADKNFPHLREKLAAEKKMTDEIIELLKKAAEGYKKEYNKQKSSAQ